MYLFNDDAIQQKLIDCGYADFVPGRLRTKTRYMEFLKPYLHDTYPKLSIRKTSTEELHNLLRELDRFVNEKIRQYKYGWKESWKPVIAFKKKLTIQELSKLGYECFLDSDQDLIIRDTPFIDFRWHRADRAEPQLHVLKFSLRYNIPETDLSLINKRNQTLTNVDELLQSQDLKTFWEQSKEKLLFCLDEDALIEAFRKHIQACKEKHEQALAAYELFFDAMHRIDQEAIDYARSLGLTWGQFDITFDTEDEII